MFRIIKKTYNPVSEEKVADNIKNEKSVVKLANEMKNENKNCIVDYIIEEIED